MRVSKGILIAVGMSIMMGQASAEDEFKIGAVLPLSGPYAYGGEAAKRGAEMAIEERGSKVLGVPIVVSWEDGEGKPQTTLQRATKLVADQVHLLIGEGSSPATLALAKLAGQRKTPLLSTLSADERITGEDGNRYTFRTSNDFGMETQMMLAFLKGGQTKSLYGVIPDVGAARDMWETVKAHLPELGITIAGEDFPPLGNKDFAVIVNKIDAADADTVIAVLAGSDTVNLVKQAGEVGLTRHVKFFGPTLMEEPTASAVGESSLGVVSGLRYHFSHDTPANKEFVARYRERYGEFPSVYAGETYDGLSWFLDTVEATGSWDKEAWVDAFKVSTRPHSIEGEKRMRPCNNQAEQIGLLGEVVKGEDPLPALTMKITKTFEASTLFTPCS